MKQNAHSRRTNRELREKLSYILLYEIADPALSLVTVTGVEVSVDKTFAKVYVSCDAASYDEVLEALGRARGRIRSLLGHALGWRSTPELAFLIDTSTDEAERIGEALKEVPPTMAVEKDEFGYPVAAGADATGGDAEAAEGPGGEPPEASGPDGDGGQA